MPQLREPKSDLVLVEAALHDTYLDFVMSRYWKAERYAGPYLDAQQGWYDLWRGYYDGAEDSGWNNVHIPMPFGVVESDIARLMDVVLPPQQMAIQCIPTGPEDVSPALRAEKLIDVQLEDAKIRTKVERVIRRADIYGKGLARVGWRRAYGPINREYAVNYERAMRLRHRAPTILKYDGPDIVPISNTEALPTPGFSDIDEMPGFFHTYYKELEEIKVAASEEPAGNYPTYDPEVVARLAQSAGAPPAVSAAMRQLRVMDATEDPRRAAISSLHQPVQIIDAFISVPREMGAWYDPQSGMFSREELTGPLAFFSTEFVITVANQQLVLRAVPLWTLTQERPIFAYGPTDDPETFWGPGKVEILAKMALGIDRLVNDQLDAYGRWIDPPWIINVNSPIVPGTLHAGPGARIWTEGPTTDQDIRQLQPNLQGVRDAFAETNLLWTWAQRATGDVEDITAGMKVGGRESATAFAGRSNAVSVRIAAEAARLERLFLEPLAVHMFDLDRLFMQTPHLLRKIGAHAVWDEKAGRFMPPQLDFISSFDLARSFDWRATGATRQLTKFMRQQQIMALLPTLVPFLQGLNVLELLREVLTVMDFRNVDRIVLSEQQMLKGMLQAAAMQGVMGTMSGGGMGEGAGGDKNRSRVSATRPPDGSPGAAGAGQDPLGNLRGLLGGSEGGNGSGALMGAPLSP